VDLVTPVVTPVAPRIVTPIVALDVPDRAGAEALVARLGAHCGYYKVGLELFSAEGPAIVAWLRDQGKQVFVDLKLHDIPNTVRRAARSVALHGAALLTVHASGGREMVQAAVDGAADGSRDGALDERCGILGVTILTSMDAAGVSSAWGRGAVDVEAEVVRLAGLVADGRGEGIVCSGHEAAAVRASYGDRLGLLIPGIRLPGGEAHDQRRVMTPQAAAEAGARWLILGRAVTGAADPVAAMAAVHAALAGVA
jgi:orotidine-5'-phosphate decarboxylase